MRLERDLSLAGGVEPVRDTLCGLAFSMNAVFAGKHPVKAPNARAIDLGREMLTRYQALVLAVAPSALEYRPDMSEQELRAWAASLINALS